MSASTVTVRAERIQSKASHDSSWPEPHEVPQEDAVRDRADRDRGLAVEHAHAEAPVREAERGGRDEEQRDQPEQHLPHDVLAAPFRSCR